MTQYDQSNYYRSHGIDSEQRKYKLSSSRQKPHKQSRGKYHDPSLSEDKYEYSENVQQMKAENQRLKKAIKQSNAKRSSLVKQCSEYQKHIEELQSEVQRLRQKVDEEKIDKEGDRYRVEELRFLNKQLGDQINDLRDENQTLMEKVRYCSDVVEKKYEDLEEKMMKRMEQAMKRVKKAVHYLETLSIKDIEKTKQILVQNLKKANDLLKGKYSEDNYNTQHQIEQLMNPLKSLQQQLSQKSKQLTFTKAQNKKLQQQVKKHKRIENELLPQYKQSIEGLKKNLAQVRAQLSQNEVQKVQLKKKYEEKVRNVEQQYQELLIQYRKNKLQKKIFENKLEELEDEKQEEKERLVGENEMLKKLYEMKKKTGQYRNDQRQAHSQSEEEGQLKETDIKPHPRSKNFKRKPNHHQQSYDNDENNLDGYNSADYYNNHKTTKNTYGDEPIVDQRKGIKRNQSYKEFKGLRSNNRDTVQDNSRIRAGRDTGARSAQNLSREKMRNYRQQKQPEVQQRGARNETYNESEDQEVQYEEKSQEEEVDYGYAQEDSEYRPEQSSIMSQESLKNQICRIDQQIMEIQKNLTKQLQAYK